MPNGALRRYSIELRIVRQQQRVAAVRRGDDRRAEHDSGCESPKARARPPRRRAPRRASCERSAPHVREPRTTAATTQPGQKRRLAQARTVRPARRPQAPARSEPVSRRRASARSAHRRAKSAASVSGITCADLVEQNRIDRHQSGGQERRGGRQAATAAPIARRPTPWRRPAPRATSRCWERSWAIAKNESRPATADRAADGMAVGDVTDPSPRDTSRSCRCCKSARQSRGSVADPRRAHRCVGQHHPPADDQREHNSTSSTHRGGGAIEPRTAPRWPRLHSRPVQRQPRSACDVLKGVRARALQVDERTTGETNTTARSGRSGRRPCGCSLRIPATRGSPARS